MLYQKLDEALWCSFHAMNHKCPYNQHIWDQPAGRQTPLSMPDKRPAARGPAEIEQEIAFKRDQIARLRPQADAIDQAIDDLSDEIAALQSELDDEQDIGSMRETARDRAWHRWRSL